MTVYQFRKHNDIPPGPLLRHSNKYKNGGRKKIIDIDYVYALIYKNGIPKGSQVWKKAVRSYYGLACVSCGYQKKEIINHCHHRIPTSKGGLNTVRNGIVLCSRCHDEEHAGLLKIPSLEINYNLQFFSLALH